MNDLHQKYMKERASLLSNLDELIEMEQKYMSVMVNIIKEAAEDMHQDFHEFGPELLPFWRNYPPEQRGRAFRNEAIPMLELGEKLVGSHIIKAVCHKLENVRFPGLPTGGDIRFMTDDAFIHCDIKITGPNEVDNEVVVPPNQVSGDGEHWDAFGLRNNHWPIHYRGSRGLNFNFQPKLPPLYLAGDKRRVCLTFYIKAVYSTVEYGVHPIRHFEVVCVPNGLLMFSNGVHSYAKADGLITSGKDEVTKDSSTRRIRVKLNPLARIANWRAVKMERQEDGWVLSHRV
ncbi:BglI family type II restriction endonuclease [Deinococcus deserti]|uniref:Putative Type II site-specific deoxyribonuclease (Type II restriction enzyme) n=1 Tax=Deinococcus deserti (strain DSM 17065 / CIP 109153 / LMG 22923 / VCD115) TaxID=546414 RepID=C1CZ61_DEIDV|nr:BglI family type II restriction endonuclease [Deinococcus deserti]ACO45099.2 putative Type II site-specific deoxyribonuclease (Type II restriction enzyme) [Deinococcus deserti VCD115]